MPGFATPKFENKYPINTSILKAPVQINFYKQSISAALDLILIVVGILHNKQEEEIYKPGSCLENNIAYGSDDDI